MKESKTLTWNIQQASFFRHCPVQSTRENSEKRRVNELTKFDTNDILSAQVATFPPKNRSDNFHRIFDGMKRKDLRKLISNATDELRTCGDTKKRWCELIINTF